MQAPYFGLRTFCGVMVGGDPIYFANRVVKTPTCSSTSLGTQLAGNKRQDGLSTSICEEALSRFSDSDDSLAGMIEQYSITVRDFMLLSLLCDQEALDAEQLERALGLDRPSVGASIERLTDAGLVKHNGLDAGAEYVADIRTTVAGRLVAQRILENMG